MANNLSIVSVLYSCPESLRYASLWTLEPQHLNSTCLSAEPVALTHAASSQVHLVLSENLTHELHVFRHDCHALGMNCGQVGVFEELDKIGLCSFLKSQQSVAFHAVAVPFQ